MAADTHDEKKRQWRVMVNIGTSALVTVEAADEEEAIEAAYGGLPSLCAHCTGWGQPWSRDEWEPDWDTAEAEPIEDQS